MIWMKEGKHYKRMEEEIKSGMMKGFTLVKFISTLENWVFEYNISPYAKLRGEEEIQKKIGDQEAIFSLQDKIQEVLFKEMAENNPVLYQILINKIGVDDYSTIWTVKTRNAKIGMSRHIPKGTMLLVLHPEDYQELEQ